MLIIGLIATALGANVLVYGPADGFTQQNSQALRDAGHTVTVWTDAQWRAAPPGAFATYDALVIGDPDCGGPALDTYQGLYDTRDSWSPLIKGNIFLSGMDAGCHFQSANPGGRARELLLQGVAWAASGHRTGLYMSSDWGRARQTAGGIPGPFGASFLTSIADLRTFSNSGDSVSLTTVGQRHPALVGITSGNLSGWSTSYHATWPQHPDFPSEFVSLAMEPLTQSVIIVAREECDFDQDGYDANSGSCGGQDCDDHAIAVNPAATEICDGIDNNCTQGVDEASAVGASVWYQDLDQDTYGASGVQLRACNQPTQFVARGGDCRDDVFGAHPGAVEIPYDGIDNDCLGGDACDVDGDGFAEDGPECGGLDCDDTLRTVMPGATEAWYDGVDQDCDGWSDYDQDRDGHDSLAQTPAGAGDDCDDFDATTYPGAVELADGVDNNCNGWREDLDTDGDGAFDEDEAIAGTLPDQADSDADGVPDAIEIGGDPQHPLDTDGDGTIDALDFDDDDDGIPTSAELGDYVWTVEGSVPPNADGDALPDYRDVDADGDGYTDEVEGVIDSDGDGLGDWIDPDSDGDTVDDSDEAVGDSDGDTVVDRLDDDDDNDGLSTAVEAAQTSPDADGDTVANWLDDDSDDDGSPDAEELDGDLDGDGIPNFVDADDLDGPLMQPDRVLRGGGCAGGASTTGGAPSGAWLGLLGLLLWRRRPRA